MKFFYKTLVLSLVLLFSISLVLIGLSPYKKGERYPHRYLNASVYIKAKKEIVFSALGDSENTRKWSVFVHHINTLNKVDFEDGSVGSVRRCFQNEDERGLRWDEEIVLNEHNQKRRLTIFNMVDFGIESNYLRTEQFYETVKEGCNLTFTLFYEPISSISYLDEFKLYLTAYKVHRIFEKNLKNIKNLVEQGDAYKRLYPFLKQN